MRTRKDEGCCSRYRMGSRTLDIPSIYLMPKASEDSVGAPALSAGSDSGLSLDVLRIDVPLPEVRALLGAGNAAPASAATGARMEVSLSYLPWWNEAYVDRMYHKTQEDVRSGRVLRDGDRDGLESYVFPERSFFCYEAGEGRSLVIYRVPMGKDSRGYRVSAVLWPGFELGYTFGVDYFPCWRYVDQRLRALFNSFLVQA